MIGLSDGFQVDWNPEKENILWEVISRSRTAESAGTDCELCTINRVHQTQRVMDQGKGLQLTSKFLYLTYSSVHKLDTKRI